MCGRPLRRRCGEEAGEEALAGKAKEVRATASLAAVVREKEVRETKVGETKVEETKMGKAGMGAMETRAAAEAAGEAGSMAG